MIYLRVQTFYIHIQILKLKAKNHSAVIRSVNNSKMTAHDCLTFKYSRKASTSVNISDRARLIKKLQLASIGIADYV